MKRDLKNVTITMEESVARWARIRAAEEDISLAQFLGRILKEQMHREGTYETAMMRYNSRGPQKLRLVRDDTSDREALH